MPKIGYTVGKARRFVAGSAWTAKKENQGKLPCLLCRGSGTVGPLPAKMCPQCELSGWEDPKYFRMWFKFWLFSTITERGFDDALFHGRPTLRTRRDRADDGTGQ